MNHRYLELVEAIKTHNARGSVDTADALMKEVIRYEMHVPRERRRSLAEQNGADLASLARALYAEQYNGMFLRR